MKLPKIKIEYLIELSADYAEKEYGDRQRKETAFVNHLVGSLHHDYPELSQKILSAMES